jgi:hypothetical protein
MSFSRERKQFHTVVSNLETGEPLWFGQERKIETLDEFFEEHSSAFQRSAIWAAFVNMGEPFRRSIEPRAANCGIVYDKFSHHAACLLPNQGAAARGGGDKWKHQSAAEETTWLSRPYLSAAESTAAGGHQDPIHRKKTTT